MATGNPTRPIGMLMRNNQRQPTEETRLPPSTGPMAGAAMTAMPK